VTTTAAVVGACTTVGGAVLARLADRGALDRLIAIDGATPSMPPPRVDVRVMDHRDRLLALALEGVDVLVHCAFVDDLAAGPDGLYGHNVGGTRNVLAAASKAGIAHLVVLGSAMAYGAHGDNPLPLEEDAPLRANPGFAYGYQRQLVEELVTEWADAHPGTVVTVLRLAPVLGGPATTAIARRLQAPRLAVPAGQSAPWQLVHVDDVAAAVDRVVADRIAGVFNVAADGWLAAEEVAAALGTSVVEVGQSTFTAVLHRATQLGLSPAPPEIMPYLLHPWVIDNARLRAHGWRAERSNRDILLQFAADNADVVALGRLTASRQGLRRTAAGAAALLALLAWRLSHR
jgi:UDP-glucose 4-epimerase